MALEPFLPPAAASRLPRALDGLHVLAVEDHAIGRILLGAMLGGLGAAATLVGSGDEARTAIAEADFDVVLVDLGLPDGPGEMLAEDLARRLRGRPTVFVAVTGRARPTRLPDVFVDWLEKPYSAHELYRMLEAVTSRAARTG